MEKHKLTPKLQKNKTSFDLQQIASQQNTKPKMQVTKKRKISSAVWLKRHFKDPLFQQKIKDGFLSRAAYKLIEIDSKFRLLRKPQVVIDLGASPGSWMQVIWNKIGSKKSKLIGIDLLPANDKIIVQTKTDPIFFIEGDFTEKSSQDKITILLENQKADLILSDIAPNTTGSHSADHLVLTQILEEELIFADKTLRNNGSMVMKLFDGSETKGFISKLKLEFSKVSLFKPESSNKDSREIYIVALKKLIKINNQPLKDIAHSV